MKRPGRARPSAARPRPDHGAVWIQPWTGAAAPCWRNSWEDGERVLESPPSTLAEAIAWARDVPAAWRRIRSDLDDDWRRLPPP